MFLSHTAWVIHMSRILWVIHMSHLVWVTGTNLVRSQMVRSQMVRFHMVTIYGDKSNGEKWSSYDQSLVAMGTLMRGIDGTSLPRPRSCQWHRCHRKTVARSWQWHWCHMKLWQTRGTRAHRTLTIWIISYGPYDIEYMYFAGTLHMDHRMDHTISYGPYDRVSSSYV